MKCLSQKQIEQFALGLTDDAALAAHLDECAACRTNLESMRSLVRQLSEGHGQFDQGHEAAREKLLANLPSASLTTESARHRNRILHWMEEFPMRRRIAVGSMAVTVLLGVFLAWQGLETKPLSAMEKMAESIRKAKSYKATVTVITFSGDKAKEPLVKKQEIKSIDYWRTPGSYRHEMTFPERMILENNKWQLAPPWKGPEPETIKIVNKYKPGIFIDHQTKTFGRIPACPNFPGAGAVSPEDWANLTGKADRDLGCKKINGKKTYGFEINIKKITPDYPSSGMIEIFIDTETNLPIHACLTLSDANAQMIFDYQWNSEINPKLFETNPPDGYSDTTPKPPSLEEQVRQITDAFNIYAEVSGGRYSQVKTFFFGTPRDFGEMLNAKSIPAQSQVRPLGFAGNANPINPTLEAENLRVKKLNNLNETARKGFDCCRDLQMYNPDFAYYGQTVTPKDKDKVLLRWKLDDGKYEVIFGDLRAETVTAERLRTLEEK
jgi:outer membrane lipoprotein-sorting protein